MTLRTSVIPGSPIRALMLSAIAMFGLVAVSHAQDLTPSGSSQSGTTAGSASMNGAIQDETSINSNSEMETESTVLPSDRRTSENTSLSDPSMGTGTTSEMEVEDTSTSLAPSNSSGAFDSQSPTYSGSLPGSESEYEIEDSTASTQSSALAPANNSADTTNQTQATFPEVERLDSRSQMKPTIGLLAGYQNVAGPVGGTAGFGVDAGVNILQPISVGIQIQYAPNDVSVGNLDADFNTTNFLARGYYNFGGDVNIVKHTYIGWKAGLVRYSGANDSDTNLALGPVLGMDFPVDHAKKFTVGPEASYLGVLDANDQFALQAAARYWF